MKKYSRNMKEFDYAIKTKQHTFVCIPDIFFGHPISR